MGKIKNIEGKGITMGELRPHDPGKSQVPLVLPDQTSTMDADVLHHEYASPNAALKNYVPHGNLTTTPDTCCDTIRVLDLFYSKAINIITEHNLLAQDLDDAFGDNDMKLAVKIIAQRDIMLLQKLKLQKRIRLLESQLKVRKRTFKEQEYYDTISEVNKKYADRVKIRNAFMEKNDIEIVPDSRDVICDSSQLSYHVVEKPSETFSKVVREAPILHASKSYDIVEIEIVEEGIVQNFPQKELKLMNIIYINAPADIMYLDDWQFEEIDYILDLKVKSGCAVQYLIDCNRKTDANEEWKKKMDTKCESGKLLNVDFSLGQDLEAQEIYGSEDILKLIGILNLELTYNLKNLDMVYITPELYSWDVHNEPSSRLFSLWFVYDRGKIDFYV